MRMLLLTAVIVLGCGLIRAEEKKPFEMAELKPWYDELLDIHLRLQDNYFILDEKLKEHSQELAECIGRPVEIPLQLALVQRHHVTFVVVDEKPITLKLRSSGPKLPLYVPFVIADATESSGLLLDFDEAYSKPFPKERLGERNMLPHRSYLTVKIGKLVPLELARMLRSGDKFKLTGEISTISVGKLANDPPYMVGLVITEAKIERVEAE